MKWSDISSMIGKVAPALGTMIGGPLGAVVGEGLSMALGVGNKPDAVMTALKNDPDALVKIKQYQIDHKYDLEKIHLAAAQQQITANSKDLETVNGTIRSEMNQQDKYTKRWRPTMGYAMTFTWVVTWMSIVYTIIVNTDKAQSVILAITQTTTLWGVALAVLGVSVWKRSSDKAILATGGTQQLGGGIVKKVLGTIMPAKQEKF